MLISQRWLREFVDIPCSPQELADTLTMLGIEVDHVTDNARAFDRFFVGFVVSREKHPNADKLSVCEVSTGGDATRTIICGAPNVDAGQKVVVAIDGAIVPNGGFEIGKRKIRGVESNGMICSRFELGIGEDDGGIWVLPDDAVVGTPLAVYLGADDVIYEISITPNRADALSHLGIAREIAAYYNLPLCRPAADVPEHGAPASELASVQIDNPDLCPRYAGRVVTGVKVAESPEWLKSRLAAVGLRPRNNVVDITNLVLMECGHPLHAFDLDTLSQRKIVVRTAADGEQFTTLDSKVRTLDSHMLMICDAEKPVAVAGVMGGENSEITDATTNVFIESAYFHPSSVRRTAKKLDISSDASYRFERGADIDNVVYAVNRAAALLAELAGGVVAPGIIDEYPVVSEPLVLALRPARARAMIGVAIDDADMQAYLERLGFVVVEADAEAMRVRVPSYRVDMEQEIDLIEEVARLYYYDNIPVPLTGSFSFGGSQLPEELAVSGMSAVLRAYLPSAGFTEVMTQNMIDPASAALFVDNPVRLRNPLGEELSVLRPSLVPSMLRVVERNIRYGERNLALFEVGKQFRYAASNEKTRLEGFHEEEYLILALSGCAQTPAWNVPARDVDFYDIKGALESVIDETRVDGVRLVPLEKEHPVLSRNAVVAVARGRDIGFAGEIAPAVLKRFDIAQPVYVLCLSVAALDALKVRPRVYGEVSPYPTVYRDLAFVVDAAVPAEKIKNVIAQNAGAHLRNLAVFDVFEGGALGEGRKSIGFSLAFNSSERTLLDSDVDERIGAVVEAVERITGAALRR